MTPPPPARIDGLVARRADVAVLFRRGPSGEVGLLRWDLRSDAVEEGQWLRGRIYAKRSDLSPDGRNLVYFAADFEIRGPYAWTAVSTPPQLTARVFLPQNHTYQGGGLFVDDRRLWLNGIGPTDLSGHGLAYAKPPDDWDATFGNSECLGVYLPRLRRDGWADAGHELGHDGFVLDATLERRLGRGRRLVKRVLMNAHETRPGRSVYSDEHVILDAAGRRIGWPGGEWAEVDRRGNLLAARDGRLLRVRIDDDDVRETVVADLNPLTFRAVPPGTPRRRVDQPSK